jgi:hypothetical protein
MCRQISVELLNVKYKENLVSVYKVKCQMMTRQTTNKGTLILFIVTVAKEKMDQQCLLQPCQQTQLLITRSGKFLLRESGDEASRV